MDYSSVFFGKPLIALKYEDIVDFFSEPREESNLIEFKAFSARYGNFRKNLNGIIRGICAFLNSDGGVLIWGAPEGKIDNSSRGEVFQGELSPVSELKEKDWIINKVSDQISPLPTEITVTILENDSDIVYVFEVQQSNYSPHQFRN